MLNAITDQALEVGSRLSKFHFALKKFSKNFGCRDFEGTTTASLKT